MAQALVTKLGRILSIDFGLGGPYNSEFGLSVSMGADVWNGQPNSKWLVNDFVGASHITPKGSVIILINSMVVGLLLDANVERLSELVNKPVLCTFNKEELESWSIWKHIV